jgi:WD40 repeat protein
MRTEPATLEVYDTATRKRLYEFPSGGNYPFLGPTFSPDGRLLAAADYDSNLTVWNLETGKVVWKRQFKELGFGLSIAFSPDGTTIAAPVRVKTDADRTRDPDPLDFPQPRVLLVDLIKGDAEECILPHGWAGGVAFSADGKTLAVGSAGAVHLLDVSKRAP